MPQVFKIKSGLHPKSRLISTQIIRRQEPQAFPGTAGLVP